MKIRFVFFFVSLLISACASGPPKKYQINPENLKNPNFGVIVGNVFVGGEIRPGIDIKKVGANEEITIIGTEDLNMPFAIALPEGEYELISIGGRSNNYVPVKEPIRFSAQAREITCIGTVYDSIGLRITNRQYSNEVIKMYGFRTPWGSLIDWSPTELVVMDTCDEIKTKYSGTYNHSNINTFNVHLAK